MNVVAARRLNSKDSREYLYEVPNDKELKEGDLVIIAVGPNEHFGVCACDSFNIDANPLRFIMDKISVARPMGSIVGRLNPEKWA